MEFHLVVALACFFIGLSKGGLGGPIPVAILTPLLSQIIPPSQAVGLVLVPLLAGDVIAISLYWRKWDSARIKQLLPWSVLGIAVGAFVLFGLANSNQNVILKRVIGAFTLLVVVYKVSSGRLTTLKYESRNWHGWLAGTLTGFGSALANVGAPPYTAYMLLQKIENPTVFIGTTSLLFGILNLVKLPIVLTNPKVLDIHLLLSILWALPIIPIGAWLGRKSLDYINPILFEQIMLVGLFILSLVNLFG
ncbi:MAG: sulfite exporter TauE/SafE family protein [Anaerolineae bacterium]